MNRPYLASPTFGGVPLILLFDRFDFLRESILDLWKRPSDPDAAAVVHTMMYYYAVLVGNRRDADRLYKQRAQNTPIGQGAVREETPDNDDDIADPTATFAPQLFDEIALRIAKNEGYPCDFGAKEYRATLEHRENGRIAFRLICYDCGFDEVIEVDESDFQAAAWEIRKENEEE